jgi:predicted transcriptional regulator
MEIGTLRYHLEILEKQGLVVGKDDLNLKTFFVVNKLSPSEQRLASLLQQKRFRDILMAIIVEPVATPMVIAKRLGLRPGTLSKYIAILEARGLLIKDRSTPEIRYQVADEDLVMKIIVAYKSSFWDDLVDNALEIYYER